MFHGRWLRVSVAAMAVALSCAGEAAAGSEATVGLDVPREKRVPVDQIDHSGWDRLLKKFVDVGGMVEYTGWKASRADRQALNRYLNRLSHASFPRSSSRQAALAFWINAYNALTVEGILREYPTSSIRNHTAKLFGYNLWEDFRLLVGGRPYSLEEIEHEILRKMGEPRIHFAIVCASIGCPRLLNEAYTADQLEQQLTMNSRNFFANQRNLRFDSSRQHFQLSSILEWFGEDFGANQAAQLRTIAPYFPQGAAQQFASQGRGSVSYLDYDWGLNDQATARTARR